jgi:signal transduction histidine kinase
MSKGISRYCISVWLLAFGFVSTELFAAVSTINLTEEEQQWIAEHPTFTVANELDWPPFDYSVNGKPLGYSIEIIELVAKKTGMKAEFISGYKWDQLLKMFQAGDIDVMPAIYESAERAKYMHFTSGYFLQPSVIVVKKENDDITDIKSLLGKRVAGIKSFLMTEEIKRKYPEIIIIEVDTVLEAVKAVSLGKADAYIDSIGLISFTLDNHFIPNLKVIDKLDDMGGLSNPSLHMSVLKTNPILFSILNKALMLITKEEKELLSKKWLDLSAYDNQMIFSEEQIQWIKQHPVVRIGLDKNYPPYSFTDSKGNYIGVVPDFLELISKKIGIKFVIVPHLSWLEIMHSVKGRRLDVVATAVQTAERKEFLNFTPVYIATPLVIIVRDDNTTINHKDDLKEMRVALVEGYSSTRDIIKKFPDIKKVKVRTALEGLQAVASGTVDAYVGVIGVNAYLMREKGISNLKIAANYDIEGNGQRFAIRSDWPELTVLINEALDAIDPKQKNAIFDHWIKLPNKTHKDYSFLWKVLSVVIIILLMLYLYNRKLVAEIHRRIATELMLQHTNQTLIEARDMAEGANHAKSRFLSSMSHELRTPLTAIVGFSDLLLLDNELKQDDAQKVQHIKDAGEHLVDLINDILDLSRIEAGKMDLQIEAVSLNQLITESFVFVSVSAKKHHISLIDHITVDTNYKVLADRIRLKQVLLNLLSNAVKYNCEYGSVEIFHTLLANNILKIYVKDTGMGLSQQQIDGLFVAFERVGAEKSSIQGTGIGLIIARRLIKAMGGEIGVTSTVSEGSTFWITIPLA